MILSKYPYVIQKEILDNMEYTDLFMFSFVSRNMKKLIKSSQLNRFQSISSVQYNCDRTDQPWVYIFPKRIKLMRIVKHKEGENGYFRLELCEKIIDFQFRREARNERRHTTYECSHLAATYYPFDKEFTFQSIQNYFLDLFGNSLKFNWEFRHIPRYREIRFYIPFLPQLQNVSFCVDFWIYGDYERTGTMDFTEMRRLEEFFFSSPVLKSIRMFARRTTELFNPDSKFYQTESIESQQSRIDFPAILSHFQGRQAFINCARCENLDLIEFVNRWKSGEAFQNLEYLQIKVRRVEIPQNQIFDAVGAKHMNASAQPPTHTVPKIYNWRYLNPNTDPITSHAYVVRETDSRVASVQIQDKTLSFGVWDKTEEAFLRMV
ncbi:unnamed protein product [Caenorhabditis nigoni]